MKAERIKEILNAVASHAEEIDLNGQGIIMEDVILALEAGSRAVDREQKLLDRIVYLRYKSFPTEAEAIEYEALEKFM